MSSRRMWTKADIVSQEQYEELVKVVPTDVHIVQDQGKWQIQLEHDGIVLSITDLTPFVDFLLGGNQ